MSKIQSRSLGKNCWNGNSARIAGFFMDFEFVSMRDEKLSGSENQMTKPKTYVVITESQVGSTSSSPPTKSPGLLSCLRLFQADSGHVWLEASNPTSRRSLSTSINAEEDFDKINREFIMIINSCHHCETCDIMVPLNYIAHWYTHACFWNIYIYSTKKTLSQDRVNYKTEKCPKTKALSDSDGRSL